MNIPAKIVVEKMEQELQRLKAILEDQPNSQAYREQAIAIKTYCDLLLSSTSTESFVTPNVKHATVADVRKDVETKSHVSPKSSKEKLSIYDDGDDPNSDSLLDF
ncbi:YwdI family protein [Evansella sp. AB-rgal1]|uniref:YwdI family protein n=1 Tax=Evansella sp. AB-rgal1 TaxID=3242696 RepID=UPI00359E2239